MYSRRILRGPAVLAALALYPVLASAANEFANNNFSALGAPIAVVVADVNADGFPDIAEITVAGTVAVQLNNGDGTFSPPQVFYITDGTPQALAVADVNGDGKLDLIVANGVSDDVSILLGNGDGTFQAATAAGTGTQAPHYSVGTTPLHMVVADLNGDGHLDIVTANYAAGTLSVLSGNGDGTFQTQTTYTVGTNPDCVGVADVNGDGKPDIVVVNAADDTLQVLVGNGDGTFNVQTAISLGAAQTGTEFQALTLGDVNKDGFPDVVVTDTGDVESTVQVLLNDQHGGFGIPNTASGAHAGVLYNVGFNPQYVTLADVNKDGNLDIVVGNITDNTVGILFGVGDINGTFGAQQAYAVSSLTNVETPQAIAVADVNGDSFPDLIVRNINDSSVQVILNRGDGTFHPVNSIDISSVGTAPAAVASADLNGDGHADLIEVNADNGTVGVLLGNGDGTFQPAQIYAVGSHPQALVVTDVNGDNKADIVVANFGDGTVTVLLNNGSGVFNTQHVYPGYANTAIADLSGLAIADVNGDGKPDIVVANAIVDKVSILTGNGDGSFNAPVSYDSGNIIDDLAIGDMDGDGHPDIVTVGNVVTILLNDGSGGFKAGMTCITCGVTGFHVALTDINGDGRLDAIVVDNNDSQLDVLLNTGDFSQHSTSSNGTTVNFFQFFQSVQAYVTGLNPTAIVLADVNNDGNLDAVVTNAGDNTVSVLLGNGQGTFIGKPYPTEIEPRGVAVANFNDTVSSDTELDLAVVNGGSNTVDVMLQIPNILTTDQVPVAQDGLLTVGDGKFIVDGQLNASDPDGDSLIYSTASAPPNGQVAFDSIAGTYSYLADTGFVGNDSFTFQVSDGVKLSNIATIQVQVATNSTAPSASKHHSFLGAFDLLQLLGLLPLWLLRRRRAPRG